MLTKQAGQVETIWEAVFPELLRSLPDDLARLITADYAESRLHRLVMIRMERHPLPPLLRGAWARRRNMRLADVEVAFSGASANAKDKLSGALTNEMQRVVQPSLPAFSTSGRLTVAVPAAKVL